MDGWVEQMLRNQGQRRRRKPFMRATGRTANYDGRAGLSRLLGVGPEELAGREPETTRNLVAKLARALRLERQRARRGPGSYDPERHLGLCAAYEAERRRLLRLRP